MDGNTKVAVVGLGYVGLPLAAALARSFRVVGFDRDGDRLAELARGFDRTREVASAALAGASLVLSGDPSDLEGAEIYVVAVPTPVDAGRRPDLGLVREASLAVGGALGRGAVVVYESTVYPGVTEEFCGPLLEAASGLRCGEDFFLGYAPERTNPGDPLHRLDRIDKVVAGQTPRVAGMLAELYGAVTSGRVFQASSIRVAEAAKVIENAQRDVNIAFVNELARIFDQLGLPTRDVLEAAATKWNFLDFSPGLVGGHCIGVDPYYLAHAAAAAGHRPEVLLAGRRVNDGMGAWVGGRIADEIGASGGRVLVLGLSFKENVPDLRNSRVADLVAALRGRGFAVDVHDPLADPADARRLHGIDLLPSLRGASGYRCAVAAVAHDAYAAMPGPEVAALVAGGGLVADVKGIWRRLALPGLRRWEL